MTRATRREQESGGWQAADKLGNDGPSVQRRSSAICRRARGGPKCRSLAIAGFTFIRNSDSIIMPTWFYAILHLLFESFTARRDTRVRFLMAQVTILRHKLGGNRVVLSPTDRAELLRIGNELKHEVKDVLGIVTPQTFRRWLREGTQGRARLGPLPTTTAGAGESSPSPPRSRLPIVPFLSGASVAGTASAVRGD
jgi:hypothetical protein